MSQDPLSMVYGGQIGQGQAQVFDTSGIANIVIQKQEQRKKDFVDSLIDYDATDVWNRDLEGKTIDGEYHKGFYDYVNDYKSFLSTNRKKLLRPSRHPELQSEKLTLESKIKHIQKTSNENQKQFLEYGKIINNPTKNILYDINEEELDKIENTPLANVGDFESIFSQKLPGMRNEVSTGYISILNSMTKPVTEPDPLDNSVQITTNKTDLDKRENVVLNEYDNNQVLQGQVLAHFEKNPDKVFTLPQGVTWQDENGDTHDGGDFTATNARDYWWANEMSQIPAPGRGTKNAPKTHVYIKNIVPTSDNTGNYNAAAIQEGTGTFVGYQRGEITYQGKGQPDKLNYTTLTFDGTATSMYDGSTLNNKINDVVVHGTLLGNDGQLYLHVSTKKGGYDKTKYDRKVNTAQQNYDKEKQVNPDGRRCHTGTDCVDGKTQKHLETYLSILNKAKADRKEASDKFGGGAGQEYRIPIGKNQNMTLLQNIYGTDYNYDEEIERYNNLD